MCLDVCCSYSADNIYLQRIIRFARSTNRRIRIFSLFFNCSSLFLDGYYESDFFNMRATISTSTLGSVWRIKAYIRSGDHRRHISRQRGLRSRMHWPCGHRLWGLAERATEGRIVNLQPYVIKYLKGCIKIMLTQDTPQSTFGI
jgi:hypothetical protein